MNLPIPEEVRGDWLNYKCPWCFEGSRNKAPFGVNIVTGRFGCFRCGHYDTVEDPEELARILSELVPIRKPKKAPPAGALQEVPDHLHRVFYERGVEPERTIHEYRILWDGSRLCWPVGDRYWRRSVFPGQSPKVKIDTGEKGLLGAHRLVRHCHVVVVEGDYGAASIPLPWIGVAIGGQLISDGQAEAIREAEPRTVTVCLDGDAVNIGQVVRMLANKGLQVRRAKISLVGKEGPDDVPMPERLGGLVDTWDDRREAERVHPVGEGAPAG